MDEGTLKQMLGLGVWAVFKSTGIRTMWIELSKKKSWFAGGVFVLYLQSSISGSPPPPPSLSLP